MLGGGGGVRKAKGHEMRSIYLIISIPLLIDGAFFCTIVQIHIKEFKKICVSKLGPKGSKLGEGIHFGNILM